MMPRILPTGAQRGATSLLAHLLVLVGALGLVGPSFAQGMGGPAAAPKVLRYAFPIAETGFDPAQISDAYSRIIAANNILNALYMVASALVCAALLMAGVSLQGLFLLLGLANLLMLGWLLLRVPELLHRAQAVVRGRP